MCYLPLLCFATGLVVPLHAWVSVLSKQKSETIPENFMPSVVLRLHAVHFCVRLLVAKRRSASRDDLRRPASDLNLVFRFFSVFCSIRFSGRFYLTLF